jgi:predicted RNA-binding protein (virulence factor B family)
LIGSKKKLERAKVTKEEIQQQDTRFLAVYVESKNSCMVMLSEREDKLGTLAIAVPKPLEGVGTFTSSVLLGDKNIISARMFAEYVASKKGKIALVSVYLDKVGEIQAQGFFNKLIDTLIKSEKQKEPTAT